MPGENDIVSTEAAVADQLEQQREVHTDSPDPEHAVSAPPIDGVEANPADVLEQLIEVPHDDDPEEPAS